MKETIIECPACKASGVRNAPPLIDLVADPNALERLLTGTFFKWTCPSCSRQFFVNDVLLCLNPGRGYSVYLVPGYKDSMLPVPTIYRSRCQGTMRVAESFVDFAEKLRIFEAGLDDRVIEAMKSVFATVCNQAGQDPVCQMVFEEIRSDGRLSFAVLQKDSEDVVHIPQAAYDRAAEDFGPLFPENDGSAFIKVDQAWFESALQSTPAEE